MKYSGYLIDLDGTLYIGKKRLPEAETFIKTLLKKDIPFLCVTNNTTRSPKNLVSFLKNEFNLLLSEEHIYTSGMAAIDYLQSHHYHNIMVIGEDDLKQQVLTAGFAVSNENPDAILQALDRQLTYEKLKLASLAIQNGAAYLLTNSDEQYPLDTGFIPGAGAIAKTIIAATKVEPILIGKPASTIMNGAVNRIGLPKHELLMIGDNYATDILAGINNGIDTLLTLTGVTQEKDLDTLRLKPTHVVNHLGEWNL